MPRRRAMRGAIGHKGPPKLLKDMKTLPKDKSASLCVQLEEPFLSICVATRRGLRMGVISNARYKGPREVGGSHWGFCQERSDDGNLLPSQRSCTCLTAWRSQATSRVKTAPPPTGPCQFAMPAHGHR